MSTPELYQPVPEPVVDKDRKVTQSWWRFFDNLRKQSAAAGRGDVVGPGSATDGAIALFDGTTGKLLKEASGTGVVHATAGVYSVGDVDLASEVTGDLPFSNLTPASAASKLLGRGSASGAGDFEEITLGTNLSMSGTTLNASGGGGSGNVTSTTAYGSEPGSPASGDLDLYTNSFYTSRYSGSAWIPWGPIFPLTQPVDGNYAWVNQGSATVDATKGGIYLYMPALGNTVSLAIRKKSAPSTPYTITACMLGAIMRKTTHSFGLCFRQSSDGKLHVAQAISNGTDSEVQFRSSKYTSATAFSADYQSTGMQQIPTWLQISDDGTNRLVRWSMDGQNWIVYHSIGNTDFLTADEVGFFVSAQNNATPNIDVGLTLLSWKET